MTACVDLARIKLDNDADKIEEFANGTTLDYEKIMNKIVAEMLLNCFKNIPLEAAAELVELGIDAETTEENLSFLDYDEAKFKGKEVSLELTQEQKDIIGEYLGPRAVGASSTDDYGNYYTAIKRGIYFLLLGGSVWYIANCAYTALQKKPSRKEMRKDRVPNKKKTN